MTKKILPWILILNILSAQDTPAEGNEYGEVLDDILNALTDDHDPTYLKSSPFQDATKYIEEYKLKSLNGSHETGITLSDYWIGSQAYSTDKSSAGITIAKVALDALVSKIHKKPVTGELKFEDEKKTFESDPQLLGIDNIKDKSKTFFEGTGTTLPNARTVFVRAYQLKYLTESCAASWPNDENKPQRTGIPQARKVGSADAQSKGKINKILNSPTACDYVTCQSTDPNSSFNGYKAIQTATIKLQETIKKITCAKNDSLCNSLKKVNLNALSATNDGSNSEMTRLNTNLKQLVPIAQAFLLKEAQKEGAFPKSSGISSIYDNTIGPKKCGSGSDPCLKQSDDDFTDGFVKTLTGITQVPPPIVPSLPNFINQNNITVAIGGRFIEFSPVKDHDYYKSTTKDGGDQLFIKKDNIMKIVSRHDQNRLLYNITRDSTITSTMNQLITKSASVEVIKELESMNSGKIGNGDKSTFQHLFESSTWRLKEPWLTQIGVASNTSLLREIAVILAEMNHKQYLDLVYKQKMILLLAVNSAKTEPQETNDHMDTIEQEHFLGSQEGDPTADFDANNIASAGGINSDTIRDAQDNQYGG